MTTNLFPVIKNVIQSQTHVPTVMDDFSSLELQQMGQGLGLTHFVFINVYTQPMIFFVCA